MFDDRAVFVGKVRNCAWGQQVAAAEQRQLFDQSAIDVEQYGVAGHLDNTVVKAEIERMEAVNIIGNGSPLHAVRKFA